MLKIVIGVLLAAVALGVFFLGREAVLLTVGVGMGVGLAELIDLGVRMAARSVAAPDELDEAPASAPARR